MIKKQHLAFLLLLTIFWACATDEESDSTTMESFTAAWEIQPNVREVSSSSCPNDMSFQAFSPVSFYATFEAVENAVGYTGITTTMGGIQNDQGVLIVTEVDDNMLRINRGLGTIVLINTCDQNEAIMEGAMLVDALNSDAIPVSIEITPLF